MATPQGVVVFLSYGDLAAHVELSWGDIKSPADQSDAQEKPWMCGWAASLEVPELFSSRPVSPGLQGRIWKWVENNSITQLCEWTTETEGKGPSQNVVRLSPSGHLVATGGTDGRVKIFEASKLQVEPVLKHNCAKNDEVLDLDFSPDNKTLASCDRTGSCRLWDPASGQQLKVIDYKYSGAAVSVRVLRYLPPAENSPQLLLAAMSAPRGPACIALYNNDGNIVKEKKLDQSPLTAMELDHSAQQVCVNFVTGGKRIYSIPAMRCLKKVENVHELPAPCAAFVGNTAVSGSGDRSINLLTCKKGGSSGGGGTSCLYFLFLIFITMVVIFFLLRIGIKSTMLSGEL
ncbi:unnamed protein product [Cladocopium goreaui]|uniref:Uncharacterized WD repeat-containing protein all2124 n=1 Tax=Cladocopium goreaui TaxID=2562237 RepID=A0A9P1FQN1_9DINO|nr:unnamed protein product [Cladocopium goreaui]